MIDFTSNLVTAALVSTSLFYGTTEVNNYVDERECLALNIYHEARGESVIGQIAVAQVTVNRVNHDYFPDTVCEVVWQPHQFSWTGDGYSDAVEDQSAYSVALNIADWVLRGEEDDPTNGSLFYHANWVNPSWTSSLDRDTQIGIHIFYTWDGTW